jgi:hypothetical protein
MLKHQPHQEKGVFKINYLAIVYCTTKVELNNFRNINYKQNNFQNKYTYAFPKQMRIFVVNNDTLDHYCGFQIELTASVV